MQTYSLHYSDTFIEPILDNVFTKVIKFSFEKGKELQKHKTSSDILVTVLEGHIRFQAEEEITLKAGDMVTLDKYIEHSIVALEKSVVLVVLTPSPSFHSIFKPIAE